MGLRHATDTQSRRSPPRGGEALWPADEVAQRGQAKAPYPQGAHR